MLSEKVNHLLKAATGGSWLPLSFFFAPLALFASLLFRGGWIEPDTYAFYNRTCLNGLDFHTPILSKIIFLHLPCEMWVWFVLQSLLFLFTLFFLATILKVFWNTPSWSIFLIGLSVFALKFFMAFEDDHLAFFMVMGVCWMYLRKPTFLSSLNLAAFGIVLHYFIWEGAIMPISLTIAIGIFPLLGFLEIIVLHFFGYLSDLAVNGSTEQTYGYGFFGNLITFPFLYYYQEVKDEVWKNKKLFYGTIVFLIVSFLQPKWGIYSLIPLVPFVLKVFENRRELLIKFCALGAIGLILVPGASLLLNPPFAEHWAVIKVAKEYQDQGARVVNFWSLGRYFQFVGGHPTEAGGYSGQSQDLNGEWYWLGPERKDCSTITSHDLIFFQKCVRV